MDRRERYRENRKQREILGGIRTKCDDCGCYIKGRHKVWCKSEEAERIRSSSILKKRRRMYNLDYIDL